MQLSTLVDQKSKASDGPVDISGFEVKGWNILVQPTKVDEKTKGGVYIPDEAKDDISYLNNICRVLALGSTAYTQEGFKGEAWCKVGDYVLIPKNTGTKLLLKGVVVNLVACDRVLAVVDDPSLLDPKFNIGVSL